MPALRIGIPIIGGPHWMAGVTYVEMLARSLQALDAGVRPELHLVATPASLAHVESHLPLLPLFRGIIILLDPGMDPAPFRSGSVQVCRDRAELYARIDFFYPVLNDAWQECSASWIPDFQHRYLPDFFSARERADRDAAFGKIAGEGRLLVLSSAAVQADFRKFYPASRVVTRVLSFFAAADEAVFTGDHGAVARRYALPERYLLCCNQFWMHKDHGTLFKALAGLRKSGLDIPLVCTGSTSDYRSAAYFDRLKAEIRSLGLEAGVRILGMVPRDDQMQIIRRSCALVQPSLFEGWSSIVEDARSLGKPIFLTDLAVHKEQDPPYGAFFKAGNPDDLSAALAARFPGLPAGPDPVAERRAREAVPERMRKFGRDFLDLAEEAMSLFSGKPGVREGVAAAAAGARRTEAVLGETGINLIGFASSNLGLGAAARNTLALLEERKVPVAVFDLDAGGGRSLHETYFARQCVVTPDQLPYGVNLWHMNPPEVVHLMNRSVPKFDWNRFNVCVPFWELPEIPDAWMAPLEAMDLVLAPTRFIAGNLAARLPSAKVRYYRQALRMPEVPRLGRETWGIPPGDMVFLTSFDCGSDLLRKNPSGTVAAFRERFRDRPGVQLIVKWVNEDLDEVSRRSAARLREEMRGQANIRILDKTMPYPEVLALYRAADAYVSLHRAEGLGLGLLESMALGKPVIGTAWSGNMDFMSESNSCLVGHRLVPVPAGTVYDRMLGGKPARWAEPDLGEAATWMLKLADDPGLRRRVGARAEEDIREYNRAARLGEAFEDLEAMLAREPAVPGRKKVFDIPWYPPAPSADPPPPVEPAQDAVAGMPRLANPKVTAIVSTYNSELFIRGCLQNLVEQTLFMAGRLEIVIIESGSSQGEGRVIAEFRSRHPEIVHVRTERETLYAAWNRAVMLARGEYIVNANTDDRHRPDAFEVMAEALDGHPEGLVYADAILTKRENETWAANTGRMAWVCPDYNLRQALVDCPFGCVVMWRRSLHDEIGYFDPALKVAGDYEFFLRAAMAKGARHVREALCLYYQSENNLSFRSQVDVDAEVNGFMRPFRRNTPLAAIYPFLSESSRHGELACAMVDLGSAFINVNGRMAPEEAEFFFLRAKEIQGSTPDVLYNLSLAYFDMGRIEDAKVCLTELFRQHPEIARMLESENQAHPDRRNLLIREHPGLDAMPKLLFYPDLHMRLDQYRPDPEKRTPAPLDGRPGPGINLIGFVSANIGLGAAARNTLDQLVRRGWQVSVFDVDAGLGRSSHEACYREKWVSTPDQLPHGINLWHLNPPEVTFTMTRSSGKFEWNRFNVCVPFWELPVFPDEWMRPMEAMDLILAPTRFIEANLATCLPRARIRYYRQALHLPELPPMGRKDFGIPEEEIVFVTSFDFGSDILRKNPIGTMTAFLMSFQDRPGVRLVIKWVNQDLDELTREASARLRKEITKYRSIQVLDRNMSYPEVLALYRAADVFVSLHKAEGLGLGLMESMALGKPVIGTAWSGNMDFMTEANSCLVKYHLADVPSGSVYDARLGGKRAQWAEPDLDDAAAWMSRLAKDPGLRSRLGARAAADIRAHNREAWSGTLFDEIASLWRKDQAAASGRPPKAFGRPSPSHPPALGDMTPEEAPASAAGRSSGPLEKYAQAGSWTPRPATGPDGGHPLHLRRLANLGLLTPPPASSKRNSKVTAIVSTYNSEIFIRGCLQNLVEQTLFAQGRLEIVVVDSGSPQGEGKVVAEYRERHPGIVYMRTERETLYAAWNRAVQASTGTYLVNANTDDRHRPDAFGRMADALDASYAGLVYGDAILTSGENETWAANTATRSWFLPDFTVRQGLIDCPFGCVVMWRRSLHDELGLFNPAYKIAGDYDFFLKSAILRGAIHLKEPLALYYESEKNLSYGNQRLVDEEVDSFLQPLRLNTPLEAIYPYLRVEHSKIARLAAVMDFSVVLLHPLARRGPVEALTRLVEIMKEVGGVPELVNNMALILMVLGKKEEARSLMQRTLAEHPGISGTLGLGTPEGDWIPTRMIRVHHDGLQAIPEAVYSAQTRLPLPGRESANWTAIRRAGA